MDIAFIGEFLALLELSVLNERVDESRNKTENSPIKAVSILILRFFIQRQS